MNEWPPPIPFDASVVPPAPLPKIVNTDNIEARARRFGAAYEAGTPWTYVVTSSQVHRLTHQVAERDGWRCSYCECPVIDSCDLPYVVLKSGAITLPATASARVYVATLDHVIPKSRGGSSTLGNLVIACTTCNSRKGARTPDEWRAA